MKTAALTGFLVLTAATAHAQGWYNQGMLGGLDPAATSTGPDYSSYRGLLMAPGGELYSTSVNSFAMNLGGGVSMGLFTSVLNGPAGGFSAIPGGATTNYASGLYLDPRAAMPPSNVSGRLSVGLGGGLSLDFLGGLSNGPRNGFYYGPGSGFDNRLSTTAGAGFSMNFGRGGTLSVIGSVSQGLGPARGCRSFAIAACQ